LKHHQLGLPIVGLDMLYNKLRESKILKYHKILPLSVKNGKNSLSFAKN
jgi:hypothetical protein